MSELLHLSANVTWKLQQAGPRQFTMLAYTGAVFDLGFGPALIDLAGLETPSSCPILRDHDVSQYVGRATGFERPSAGLVLSGVLFDTPEGRQVALMSDQGAEWQASVGVAFSFDDLEAVPAGKTIQANGQKVTGPLTLIKRAQLRESSFVPLGADSKTHAVALADAVKARLSINPTPKEAAMASPEKVAASVKELRAAFANDPSFALDAAERGLSLLEAKAEYADKLQAKLSAQNEEQSKQIADLQAKLAQASKAAPAAALGGTTPAPAQSGDPVDAWQFALAAECDRLTKIGWRAPASKMEGLTLSAEGALRAQAMHNVAEKNPQLHQAYLEGLNGCEWTRIRREQRKTRVGR